MVTIRISQAGACPRRIQLEAWGVPGAPPWEGSERAFAEGRLHEPSILEWAATNLPGGPYEVHSQQKEVVLIDDGEQPVVVGHIDGIGTNKVSESVLLEAKCLANRGFQELREKGVKKAHPQYYTQVQLYLAGTRLNRGYLVARNKETPKTRMWDMYYEEIIFDPAFVVAEIMRLKNLIEKIEQHVDIDPPYNPEDDWHCRPPYCPYTEVCWPGWHRKRPEAQDRSDLIAVVETLRELNEEIKALEEFREQVKAQLLQEVNGGPVQAGRWLVQAVERRQERFDPKVARKELPPEILSKLLKVTTYRVLEVKEAM